MRHVPHLPLAAFVGREAELSLLEGLLPSRNRSRAIAVAVIGDPGIGKTRLTDAFLAAARVRSIRAVRGVAYEVDEPLPYSVPSDLFAQWVREDPAIADSAREHEFPRRHRSVVPHSRRAPHDLNASPPRMSAFDFLRALRSCSGRRLATSHCSW